MSPDKGRRSVALVTPGWPPSEFQSGIVTYVDDMRGALGRLGVDVPIVAAAEKATSDGSVPATVDLRTMRSPVAWHLFSRGLKRLQSGHAGLMFGFAVARAAKDIQLRQGLDLIEMEETFGAAWYAQQIAAVPIVVRLHGPWFLNGVALGAPIDAAFRRQEAREARCIGAAVGVTSPSRDVLRRVRERYGLALPDAEVIPNPAPLVLPQQRWNLAACDRKTILFVGRFDRHKGGDIIIDAFAKIADQLPSAELVFVGPDRGLRDDEGRSFDLPAYMDARLAPSVRARVRVMGPLARAQIDPLRRQAFVTVVPSRYENFPLALVEALAVGCPTVASDVGGIPEILTSEKTGLLFAPGDASALAARLGIIFERPQLAAELGHAAAVDMASRFASDAVARSTLAYYQSVWSSGRRVASRSRSLRALYRVTAFP